jgi:hypothetical protein
MLCPCKTSTDGFLALDVVATVSIMRCHSVPLKLWSSPPRYRSLRVSDASDSRVLCASRPGSAGAERFPPDVCAIAGPPIDIIPV